MISLMLEWIKKQEEKYSKKTIATFYILLGCLANASYALVATIFDKSLKASTILYYRGIISLIIT